MSTSVLIPITDLYLWSRTSRCQMDGILWIKWPEWESTVIAKADDKELMGLEELWLRSYSNIYFIVFLMDGCRIQGIISGSIYKWLCPQIREKLVVLETMSQLRVANLILPTYLIFNLNCIYTCYLVVCHQYVIIYVGLPTTI